MNTNTIKVKKGGIDSIIAFIVVLLPLVYVLIFMVATLYHFSVQMYLNQVVKETLVMASTYGTVTKDMEEYMVNKLDGIITFNEDRSNIHYYIRKFNPDTGVPGTRTEVDISGSQISGIGKADLLSIQVLSKEPSLLATVSSFNIFGANTDEMDNSLKYSAYREEIIRNDPK